MAAGDTDTSFGISGLASINFPGNPFFVNDVALQSDGKVIVAGTKGGNAALTRLNVNGTLDTTFGNGGLFESNESYSAGFIAVQADDRIVVKLGDPDDFFERKIGRLAANGHWDSSFGSLGIVISAYVNTIRGMALQQDGKIIFVGSWQDGDNQDFGIARLTSTGAPDGSFDGDGYKKLGFGADEYAAAVAIDYNGTPATNPFYGSVVVAGNNHYLPNQSSRVLLCRLLANGNLDNSFDGDGKMTSPELSPQPGESATGVLIQPGGKIVLCGTALASGGGNEVGDILLARYLSNGAFDAAFGPSGTGILQHDRRR